MFAGPNGSGKTTVQRDLAGERGPGFLAALVNPDEIEAAVLKSGRFDLGSFGVTATGYDVRAAFAGSEFLKRNGMASAATAVKGDGPVLDFSTLAMNSYHASVLADFLRRRLLAESKSFSFETVMSERGKVDFLQEARAAGFRTYLYFVSTEDPEINIARVALRVTQGGHDVPRDKIISRYTRSLELARDATRHTDRAYFFDTSGGGAVFVAESEAGNRPETRGEAVPSWFKTYLWDRF